MGLTVVEETLHEGPVQPRGRGAVLRANDTHAVSGILGQTFDFQWRQRPFASPRSMSQALGVQKRNMGLLDEVSQPVRPILAIVVLFGYERSISRVPHAALLVHPHPG